LSAYLVVITSAPDSAGSADRDAQTTIRVETDGSATRIVEMTMRSTGPQGLLLGEPPWLDLAAVGRALIASAGTAGAATAAAAEPTPVARTVRPRRSTSSPSTTARKRPQRNERAYRRMPEVEELLAAHAKIGSVTKLAEHYGVPRHTAQGWMGRARKQAK
jgi:hypothetical protein